MASGADVQQIPFIKMTNPKWRRYLVAVSDSVLPSTVHYSRKNIRESTGANRAFRSLTDEAVRISREMLVIDAIDDFYVESGPDGGIIAVRIRDGQSWVDLDLDLQQLLQPLARES